MSDKLQLVVAIEHIQHFRNLEDRVFPILADKLKHVVHMSDKLQLVGDWRHSTFPKPGRLRLPNLGRQAKACRTFTQPTELPTRISAKRQPFPEYLEEVNEN